MASLEFLLGNGTQRSLITLDVADEAHNVSAEITKHPVEDGSTISDHVIIGPKTFVLDAIISNDPILEIGDEPSETRGQDAYDKLLTYFEQAKTFSLITSLRSYSTCLIKGMSTTRTAGTTSGWHGKIEVEQIATSRTEESTEFPRREPGDKSRGRSANGGTQGRTEASQKRSEGVEESFLFSVGK